MSRHMYHFLRLCKIYQVFLSLCLHRHVDHDPDQLRHCAQPIGFTDVALSTSVRYIRIIMESTKYLRDLEQTAIKTKRTKLILDTAYKLYLEKGIANVEMKHIAAATQISRATLYRYFPSKLTLTFAILKHVATEQLIPKYRPERDAFEGNGYEKFAQFVEQLVNAYQLFPDFFRFFAMVNYYYGQQLPAQEQANWYRELFPGLYLENTPRQFLQEGQLDGSVRQDIDPHIYLATVLETLPAVAEHIAINPELTRLTHDVESPDILLETAAEAMIRALVPIEQD